MTIQGSKVIHNVRSNTQDLHRCYTEHPTTNFPYSQMRQSDATQRRHRERETPEEDRWTWEGFLERDGGENQISAGFPPSR